MPTPAALIQPRHDLTPTEIDMVEDRLYEHNSAATGRDDGQGMGFVIKDDAGTIVGLTNGYTWAGVSEIRQMWVAQAYRGRGYGRALLEAMIDEATRRGVGRIWVASYDFQAPGMYERLGFKRMAAFDNWPEGRVNVILCKVIVRP